MKTVAAALAIVLTIANSSSAMQWVQKPSLTRDGAQYKVSFEIDKLTDVEVAIINSMGEVVRHLAAGVLGKNPPPPLKAESKAQTLVWDGKDDYKEPAKGGPFKVRVRAGMGVKMHQIAGGNPYAWYSRDMGQGDHATWCITGIDAKSDGSVYVMGNGTFMGPAQIRKYDAEGKYLKTVFPPPAGLPIDKAKGWGIIDHKNGTYRYKYKDLFTPKLSTTVIHPAMARIADLVPIPELNKLLLNSEGRLMTVNTDGSVPQNPMMGPMVRSPSMVHPEKNAWKIPWKLRGTPFIALTPDGKSFYLSGIYAATRVKIKPVGAEPKGFWRDGQVYKVDMATRTAKPFFTLPTGSVITKFRGRGASPIGDTRYNAFATFQGVAVDKTGNVFVCDRRNKRVLVLNSEGRKITQIPVTHPDAIAVHPTTKSLYVTTRIGNYHKRGELKLLVFNDWSTDKEPARSLLLVGEVGTYPQRSHLAIAQSKGRSFLWVGYTTIPIRIFEIEKTGIKVAKDFYNLGNQRALDFQHFAVDPKTESIYVADGFKKGFVLKSWKKPKFEPCMSAPNKRMPALSVAIDYRNRILYIHDYMRREIKHCLYRFKMDGEFYSPLPVGDTGQHAISGKRRVSSDWNIGAAQSQRGIAVAPCGCIAALGSTKETDFSGPLFIFKRNEKALPWKPMAVPAFSGKPHSGGIRFDPAGNMYVGKLVKHNDNAGTITKFKPTGTLKSGCMYPTPPKPAKVYKVAYGYRAPSYSRTPRFGVDGYGRIYYPKSLHSRVEVMDNEGTRILGFGTYANRDSMGGLKGDLVPIKGVPLAFPNSVDASDDYIYVSDMVNLRLIRLKKTFKLEG